MKKKDLNGCITINYAKKILGKGFLGVKDEEIEKILEDMYFLANLNINN